MALSPAKELRMAGGLLIISIALAIFLLALGCFHVWQWNDNPKPLEITASELIANPPYADWLTVTHCTIDYSEAVSATRDPDKEPEIYAPVWAAPGDDWQSPAPLVLKVNDSSARQVIQSLLRLKGDAQKDYAQSHRDALLVTGSISGMRKREILNDGFSGLHLEKALWKPAANYMLIDQDARPSLRFAVIQLGAGVGLCLFAAYLVRGIRQLPKRALEPILAR